MVELTWLQVVGLVIGSAAGAVLAYHIYLRPRLGIGPEPSNPLLLACVGGAIGVLAAMLWLNYS